MKRLAYRWLRRLLRSIPSGLVFAALMTSASCSRAPTPDQASAAVRGALVTAYEARLLQLLNDSQTCPEAVARIRAEEIAWVPVWSKAGAAPEAPLSLQCKQHVDSPALELDGGAE